MLLLLFFFFDQVQKSTRKDRMDKNGQKGQEWARMDKNRQE